jgi:hypothetical protein
MTLIAAFDFLNPTFDSIEALLADWDRRQRDGAGRWYVYAFRAAGGSVFYVGKGYGSRAHDAEGHRHGRLGYYVAEFLNQQYSVELLRSGLSNNDAELLEALLVGGFGYELVNWAGNLGRPPATVPPLAQVREKASGDRNRARAAASEHRLDEAIAICRDCLSYVSEWQRAEHEDEVSQLRELAKTSLAARVDLRRAEELPYLAPAPVPACEVLSDLTQYLCESGRAGEARQEVETFTQRYPHGSFRDYEFYDHRYGKTIRVAVTKREQATLRRIDRALRTAKKQA